MAVKDGPADGVVAGLAGVAEAAGLGQRELLARVTQFCRGTGQKQLEYKVIRIQVIRAPAPWQDQHALWRQFLMISHQLLGLREHPRHEDYRKRLGSKAATPATLDRGVVVC
jgi:hypothetical protein